MKKIVIMPNACKDPGYLVTRETVGVLSSAGAEIYMQEDLRAGFLDIGIHWYGSAFPDEAEAIAVVGGDGSVLDAAVYALARDIPLIGINMGRLGYLTELEADEIGKLAGIFENEPRIRRYMTLQVSLVRSGVETVLSHCPVNDVVVGQGNGEGMSELLLEDGVGNRLSYLADGLILATPLGSTAYTLSAGGPVIDASLDAICVTPICAHSLFSRSLLFPPEYTISVRNVSAHRGSLRVSLDGAENYELFPDDCVRVTRSRKVLKMLTLKKHSVLDALFRKLQLLNQTDRRFDHEK